MASTKSDFVLQFLMNINVENIINKLINIYV